MSGPWSGLSPAAATTVLIVKAAKAVNNNFLGVKRLNWFLGICFIIYFINYIL